jgi:hypothetical protein
MNVKLLAGAIAALLTAPAGAQQSPVAAPQVNSVVHCRSEVNDQARLRCFDQAVAALALATEQGEVFVVNREEVRRTRRSLFGFALPDLPFFRGDKSQEEEQQEVIAKIKTAREIGYGKWMIELETGAMWQTTESRSNMPTPRAGRQVRIKKAALGSYMLSVEGAPSVRGMRVR